MTSTSSVAVAVVGRGMIGGAAARHLAESGVDVALIGPREPSDYTVTSGPFASHYDEARITRISSADEVWADLAASSIFRYGDIAGRSGINFSVACGLLQTSIAAPATVDIALARGGSAELVDHEWVTETTGIALPTHCGGVIHESSPAGVISPRRLVAAQVALCASAGALVVEGRVDAVRRVDTAFEVTTEQETIIADQVVLATGAYGATLVGINLAIQRRLRTVLLAELQATHELPCLIIDNPAHPELERAYWTPPVRYPDGRHLLKIGGSVTPFEVAHTDHDIATWFRLGGSAHEAAVLQEQLQSLLPDVAILSTDYKPCVMAYTPTEHPYVGFVDDGIVVALGGNGSAAKSSDELGRLAASLIAPQLAESDQVDLGSLTPVMET